MPVTRSFIIPVLDNSPHSSYNINTLLDDLTDIPGEVICIINNTQMFTELKDHPRVDKYCLNSHNPGVSRSWNMGINMSEGDYLYILNADLHVGEAGINKLEMNLELLHNAVIVGPEGSDLKFIDEALSVLNHYKKGTLGMPEQTDNVSGFYMAIHAKRFHQAGLQFDSQFTPCFMEEWDIGFQVRQAGLSCYVVPLDDYDHQWGISLDRGQSIQYFNSHGNRTEILNDNALRLRDKWFDALIVNPDSLLHNNP